jgi:small subunit ribosomal protein S17
MSADTDTISGAANEQQQQKRRRQQKVGRVTSDKMQKTITVSVESLKRDRIYKRTYKYTTKFKAHDEENSARIGDLVRIEETRPLSKDKRWRLVEILQRAVQVKPVEEVVAELEPELETAADETEETEDEE